MVQKKRTYKKRAYRRRYKRTYRRRGYKRRFYKPIKKPEIHIVENGGNPIIPYNNMPFDSTAYGVGKFINLTAITSNNSSDMDELKFKINGKEIEGKKIRLKYFYMKGYIKVGASNEEDADDFNCKLMVFRWKRNTANNDIQWKTLMNNVDNNDPTTWTDVDRLRMLYMQDWKNDIKINFYKKVKNLYRKYDDANNIIPFKIRIPLYDCVLTCDSWLNQSTYTSQVNPSTNGLYFTYLSNRYNANTIITYKTKLYYTDY